MAVLPLVHLQRELGFQDRAIEQARSPIEWFGRFGEVFFPESEKKTSQKVF